nr:RNA-directed DNA polymerase, eukaryota [Tanacetum cinerariifolium]
KITHRGKVYLARAKELFAWTLIFLDCKVLECISDDDVLHSASNNSVGPQLGGDDLVVDSDVEGVSDTIFYDNLASPVNSVDDPVDEGIDTGFVKESSPSVHSKVMNNSDEVHVKESLTLKRSLWEYISLLISRWDGLVDVKLEGYSFTWSHPSASKMSKLDRFLVSEDFGPTPFRLYHSWFKRDGFDAMVEHAWNSFSHSDSNRATSVGVFNGIQINDLTVISHLFYADDAIFMEQWSNSNMANIVKIQPVILSSSKDRWTFNLNGDGEFRVKEVRSLLDNIFLPSANVPTRWVKFIPIKINIFTWRARLDRLPTRSNLMRRGVVMDSDLCPMCCRLRSNRCWEEFVILLGGTFGFLGITLFLMRPLRD